MAGTLRRLARCLPIYARVAWWGLVEPRAPGHQPLIAMQGVILGESGVLLTVRGDLRGWELPGGSAHAGESDEQALGREVLEETGLAVRVERHVGDYVRSGFRPHTARIFLCRPTAGAVRPSDETPVVRWFDPERPPATLFPWYRAPLRDALVAGAAPVLRHERWGIPEIWAGLSIDLRMRISGDRAGLP